MNKSGSKWAMSIQAHHDPLKHLFLMKALQSLSEYSVYALSHMCYLIVIRHDLFSSSQSTNHSWMQADTFLLQQEAAEMAHTI